MYKKLHFSLLLALLLPLAAFAQSGTITGTITEADNGVTVPAANIVLVQISKGTTSDAEGKYTLTAVPAGTYTLRASSVGFKTFETTVQVGSGIVTLNIELETDILGLDELIVTGYGQVSKRELTGSIARVSSRDFEDVTVQNTESLLQGRAAGVTITTTSGNPGGGFNVRVRGQGSLTAGNAPLYIVDGVQISFANQSTVNDLSPLNAIAPQDIESIEVLKDASAAAIYGAQAANGVVLITTKRGRAGATQINVNFETGFREVERQYDLLNSEEWFEFHVDAWGEATTRSVLSSRYGYDPAVAVADLQDFDWQDFIYRRGVSQNLNFNATGGDEKTRFFISGGREYTESQVEDVDFTRYNVRANIDHDFNDKFDARVTLGLTSTDSPSVCQDGFFVNCPFYQSIEEAPVSFPFLPDGSYNPNTEQGGQNNPAVILFEEDRETRITQIVANIAPTYKITDWLSINGLAGIDYRAITDTDYESPIADPGRDGSVFRRQRNTTNFNVNGVINARKTFDEVHNVSGLIGSEYRREFTDQFGVNGTGLGNPFIKVINGAADNTTFIGSNSEYRIASYFGQAKYTYDDKYFLTVTGRYDGSSRFGADERWGFFPSASVAWAVSNEDFFTVDFIDDLKIRAGYGITGNAAIGNFSGRGSFASAGSYSGTAGLSPSALENNVLTWEEATEINIGVDYSALNGRISGSIDVYQRNNTDLLLNQPLPRDSGFGSILSNVGEVENKGLEFEIRSVNVNSNDFLWSTSFNFAVQTNEVVDLVGDLEQLDQGSTPNAIGHSINAWWVPRWAGVNPADGRPLWLDGNGELTYTPGLDDNVFYDGGEQDLTGGFGNRVSYKGVSLDVFFQFSYGGTALPSDERTYLQADFENSLAVLHTDRWRQPGDIASYPRATPNGGGFFQSDSPLSHVGTNFLFDASYIRLKNVSLSYNLPTSITDQVNLRGVRVYLTGLNLYTWTQYPGRDPEVATISTASFPTAIQYSAGIELKF